MKFTANRTLLLVIFLLGCDSSNRPPDVTQVDGDMHEDAVPSLPTLVVFPQDLATGLDRAPVVAGGLLQIADRPFDYLETGDGARIRDGLSLVEWPEQAPISASIYVNDVGNVIRFEVNPVEPLRPHWYAVRAELTGLSRDYDLAADGVLSSRTGADRRVSHAFYYGSLPIVDLEALPERDEVGAPIRLVLTAGEPVHFAGAADLLTLLSISGSSGDGRCTVPADADPSNDLPSAGRTSLVCENVSLREALTVHISPGLQSATGVPLVDSAGTSDIVITWNPSVDGSHAPRTLSDTLIAMGNSR